MDIIVFCIDCNFEICECPAQLLPEGITNRNRVLSDAMISF